MNRITLTLLAGFVLTVSQVTAQQYMIVGTYTGGKSEGIYVYRYNDTTGIADPVSNMIASNPSYVAVSPDQKYVYAVHENADNGNGGEISAYSFDAQSGKLSLLNKQFTAGDHPCYVDVDKTGKWVFTANYSSGTLSVLPVNADGSLGVATTVIKHSGSSINKERQEKSHVHCTYISPDNKTLYVVDLGIDKVMAYSFDATTGKLTAAKQPFINVKPGAGPRHLVFHPNGRKVYLIEELTGNVVVYDYLKGSLKQIQETSTLPRGQKGFAGSADIHVSPDGKFLYASNRGDFNNIAIYKIDPVSGKLNILGFQPTLGKAPRNFNFDISASHLLVGNQDSDEIVVFDRDKVTGLLKDSGNRISVGKPVCIRWIR